MARGLIVIGKILAIVLLTAMPVGCVMAPISSDKAGTLIFGTLMFTPVVLAGLALGLPIVLILTVIGRLSTPRLFLVAIVVGTILGSSLGLINIEAPPDAPIRFNANGAMVGALIGAGFGGWAGFVWVALFGKPTSGRTAEAQAASLVSPSSSG